MNREAARAAFFCAFAVFMVAFVLITLRLRVEETRGQRVVGVAEAALAAGWALFALGAVLL